MDWLRKMPIVSLLFAAAIVAVPLLLALQPAGDSSGDSRKNAGRIAAFENARESAREYFVRNYRLDVDGIGQMILDAEWVESTRQAAEEGEAEVGSEIRLPPRLLARSQTQLDGLVDEAYRARMIADPAWRLGVLDAKTPRRNYIAHAFVHDRMQDQWAGVVLCVVVLLLVGAPLERTWGSPIFAVFVFGTIPIVAQAYRLLDGSGGVPWSGGAGLAGALLGAYFIRGLGGHFILPGWILLPAWVAAEAFIVRGFWLDDLGAVPWATLCAAVGLGAAISSGLRLMNYEARSDALAQRRRSGGANPIVARAARMRSDGDAYQAFDLIQTAWREDPEDTNVAEAFYSIAVEVGQPGAAADAILPSLRSALRQGDVGLAIDYWFPLATHVCDVPLEPTAFVRLGEALLDAGHIDEALFSLRGAMAAGASSSHAMRIVNIARDLDEELARKAATIAVADPDLEPKLRAELEGIAAPAETMSQPSPTASPEPPPESNSQLDRRVHAEHQTIETTAFPLDLDDDLEGPDLDTDFTADLERPDLDTDFTADLAASDSNETALTDQSLDAGALSLEKRSTDAAERMSDVSADADEGGGDVLSHWGDEEPLEVGPLADVSDALRSAVLEEALLDAGDLETPDTGFNFGLRADAENFVDPRDDETDSDFTPLVDATDELTSPLDPSGLAGSDVDTSSAVFDQPTIITPPPPRAVPTAAPASAAPPNDDFAFGGEDSCSTRVVTLRVLKAIEAVPVEATDESIEIDADGRGKSKLPLSRIDGITVAAIDDLGPRPVLIIDCLLNWASESSEPLKLIRFRSDRFDPTLFAPGAESPLVALRAWVVALQAGSDAQCLPSRDVLDGRFARYASLAEYEREVLMAASDR